MFAGREVKMLFAESGAILPGMGESHLQDLFDEVDRDGSLCLMDLDGSGEIALRADELVSTGSAFKVAIALEVFCQADAGEIDLAEWLPFAAEKSDAPGASISVAAEAMMQLSDNGATSALLARVTQPRVLDRLAGLGLTNTFLSEHLLDDLDEIAGRLNQTAQQASFSDWFDIAATVAGGGYDTIAARLQRVPTDTTAIPVDQLGPITTARELAILWAMIWRDEAGPPRACAALRATAGETGKTRIATAFPADSGITYTGKGGGPGLINNDAGIITYPDGHRYAIAVLTRARTAFAGENRTDLQLGRIAVTAATQLRAIFDRAASD